MRLIGGQDLLNRIYMAYCRKCKHQRCYDCKISNVKQMIYGSTVCDVDPGEIRSKGKWIIGEMGPVGAPIHCSKCGWGTDHADPNTWLKYLGHNFCGACGAKMEE